MSTAIKKRPTFRVGDKVTWTSQSAASRKTKTGTVIRIVPENFNIYRESYLDSIKSDHEQSKVGKTTGELSTVALGGGANTRNHESYLVIVVDGKKAKLYWPLVTQLSKVPKAPKAQK